ncbi:lipid II:glycine glycyltransferase (peptidoglycan interpeptide bridge formation enzyme) [Friedmanniella endophytica]|uniref:Lipid II:glycine glycyltransferase (Peptidoglycan interpeptide bridge formation enzyme) n=1 Tax=Microlunatus kandeliicorticis TaxID=1759536 RepID=A0A7W3P5A0_9ACTN|nr:peptidoglycan bridge formation glycyltransferase FemA/FemB family protein [Microlunatus kandeliicorticis]MBA8793756.1 lipid II:glycine glycyltransferase (peptidoglycan interpeptide bridge formation enzyme) [Microlunatus kandeliicorticis]
MSLQVRPISTDQHRAFNDSRPSVSFLQTPAWAQVKSEWGHESIGWYDGSELVGAGLVLHRRLPRIGRSLAYLPEGPVIDWESDDLDAWLAPMVAHLKRRRAFAVRLGGPVVLRRWNADTTKAAIADPTMTRIGDAPPDHLNTAGVRARNQLRHLGWRPPRDGEGFAAGQPKFVFQLPLADRTEDELLAGMNQLWRRNIKKAAKAGVTVTRGSVDDLAAFHAIYTETAARDHFTPRPLSYFRTMVEALTAEDPDRIRLYLAHHEGDLIAATTWVRVGEHAWYSYGASTTAKREFRGSNAVQWQMIRDAREAGATVYDLRGITDSVDPDDPHIGLIQFKVGTGGQTVEYLGEWDLPLNRPLYAAFDLYLRRR